MSQQVFTLLQVSRSIQKVLSERYTQTYWIQAEMNKLNFYQHSGHCYPELVEKVDGKIVAQVKATLWRQDYQRINFAFMRTLREPLKDGIKVLLQAKITYDPIHGLSLAITDIDPNYTLGDLEREKQQSIQTLQAKGIWNSNRERPLPVLVQRLAIISVETSKGYADFMQVLEGYQRLFNVQTYLFPALLQGDKAAKDIRRQLLRIRNAASHFDAVAIIRGGGGDVGLTCYNDLELAETIAEFPLPVWTGIGHATNLTVAEMIAHTTAITPTQLAEKLARHNEKFTDHLHELSQRMHQRSLQLLQRERQTISQFAPRLTQLTQHFLARRQWELTDMHSQLAQEVKNMVHVQHQRLAQIKHGIQRNGTQVLHEQNRWQHQLKVRLESKVNQLILKQTHQLQRVQWQLQQQVQQQLKEQNHQLDRMEQQVYHLDPQRILQRGYSMTLHHGKLVQSTTQVAIGDQLTTWVADGKIESTLTNTTTHDLHGSL